MITNEILEAIDEVSNVTLESMIDVYSSLCAEYEKSAVILEECAGNTAEYAIIQEGAVSDEVKKMGAGQNTFVRILTLIPRIIMALFKVIKSKLSKSVEKADKESKRLGKSLSKMTEEVKQKLFGKTDKDTKTKAIMTAIGLGIVGAVVGGKKIHEKVDMKHWKEKTGKYAPDKVKEKHDKLIENSLKTTKIIDKDGNLVELSNEEIEEKIKKHEEEKKQSETKAAEKPAEEKKEPEVPAEVEKLVNALEDLSDFYQKYVEEATKYELPITYENGRVIVKECVSKTVDIIIDTMNDFEKILNGSASIKKMNVRYNDTTKFEDMSVSDSPEKCSARVKQSYDKFIKNEDRMNDIIKKGNEEATRLKNMSRDEKKALGNKEVEKIQLCKKLADQLGIMHSIFTKSMTIWDKTVDVIKYVNDCFDVADTNDDNYKAKVERPNESSESKK